MAKATPVIEIELGYDKQFTPSGRVLNGRPGNAEPVVIPLGKSLRGRWRRDNMHPDLLADQKVRNLPIEMPGYHVELDIAGRRVKIYDPLYDSPDKEKVTKAWSALFGNDVNIDPPMIRERLTKTEIWEWIRWCYSTVLAGECQLIAGQFPREVAERMDKEREWLSNRDPNTGKYEWEPLPDIGATGAAVGAGATSGAL